MRDYGGELTFRPRLPKVFAELRFPLLFQGRRLRVTVRRDSATYELVEGDILVITHCQERVRLRPREPVTLPVAPADECGDPER
jgi:alpha,alpha-trehalose phosphorylase